MHKLLRWHYRENQPDKRAKDELLLDYWEALADMDEVAYERGVRLVMATMRYFPKPVEIRELGEAGLRNADPEMDADLVRAARTNAMAGDGLRLLPQMAQSPIDEATREARMAELRERTMQLIREGGARAAARPSRKDTARRWVPADYAGRADAERVLRSLDVRPAGEGAVQ